MIVKNYPVSSMMIVQDENEPGVPRAPLGANPVNATQYGGNRPHPDLNGGIASEPHVQAVRTLNPKLNTTPWSITHAQQRGEPPAERSRGKARRARRKKR
jgi:hypothetical protein